jgi:hypothetical protein
LRVCRHVVPKLLLIVLAAGVGVAVNHMRSKRA